MEKVFCGIDLNGSAVEVKIKSGIICEVNPMEQKKHLHYDTPSLHELGKRYFTTYQKFLKTL